MKQAKTMKKKVVAKKSDIGLIPMTLILAGITLVFILLVTQSQKATINKVGSPTVVSGEPSIKNTSDLDAVAKQLDQTNPDTLDAEMKTLSTDTAAF